MPAREMRRLERRLRAVIAGRGLRVRECKESIMQLERLSARSAVSDAKESGICENKLADKSSELSVLANGTKPAAPMLVSELSARLRCLRKRHFVDGRVCAERRFELLPRGLYQVSDVLECELFEPDLFILCPPLICPCADPVLELVGRTGELLLGLPLLDLASETRSPDIDLAISL